MAAASAAATTWPGCQRRFAADHASRTIQPSIASGTAKNVRRFWTSAIAPAVRWRMPFQAASLELLLVSDAGRDARLHVAQRDERDENRAARAQHRAQVILVPPRYQRSERRATCDCAAF